MPEFTSHVPGTLCWVELATKDQNAAKAFYSALFGWHPNDNDMGPGGTYTIFQLNGRDAAAGYTMRAEEAAAMPPHWNLYISVESADAAAERAKELGGSVIAEPFDVMTHGRMAVIADAAGAVFCVWQPINNIGVGVKDEAGGLCWADLSAPDQNQAMGFYHKLFGWTFMPGDDNYQHIQNGETFIGGIPPAQFRDPKIPPHWLVYFQVDDCNASTDKAKELGANVVLGPFAMGDVGHITVLMDPQGAAFAIFQQSQTE
jgi:predicted enzyme related to lactoylglutathione lyase